MGGWAEGICKCHTIAYKGLEHTWTLILVGVLKPIPCGHGRTRASSVFFLDKSHSQLKAFWAAESEVLADWHMNITTEEESA